MGSCYRPPSANSQYLDNMCEMLDNVCDINREVCFLADLNIDWLFIKLPTQEKNLQTVISERSERSYKQHMNEIINMN